ncbi:MAG: MFS transporter [Phycisphaerae bacterium]
MNEKAGPLKFQLFLFLCAVGCMAAAGSINDSIFNNFLNDTFKLSAKTRGWLELPREMPGFMVVAMTGILAALPVTGLGRVGVLGFVGGMIGLGLFGFHYWPMVLMMMLASSGMHLLMPVTASIALALGNEKNRGKRMGQTGAVETMGIILGTGFVWLLFSKTSPQYRMGFICAAVVASVAILIYSLMHIPHLHQPRSKLVFRKKYALYYLLELMFGARKQIFLTFGPWVLITVYHRPANTIANLLMIAAVIGIVFKPAIGFTIDRFGERGVMIADGLALIFVCLGYGYAHRLTANPNHALLIASGCYIADNLLFAMSSARAIYLSRLTDNPQELTSTLAMGVSINHVVSMTIPILAGTIWTVFGYENVFLAAAVLAVLISGLAMFVPRRKEEAVE